MKKTGASRFAALRARQKLRLQHSAGPDIFTRAMLQAHIPPPLRPLRPLAPISEITSEKYDGEEDIIPEKYDGKGDVKTVCGKEAVVVCLKKDKKGRREIGGPSQPGTAVEWTQRPSNVYTGCEARYVKLPGSRWGNPFHFKRYQEKLADGSWKYGKSSRALYIQHIRMHGSYHPGAECLKLVKKGIRDEYPLIERARKELRGKKLGCYCETTTECHAQILADAANGVPIRSGGHRRPNSMRRRR